MTIEDNGDNLGYNPASNIKLEMGMNVLLNVWKSAEKNGENREKNSRKVISVTFKLYFSIIVLHTLKL